MADKKGVEYWIPLIFVWFFGTMIALIAIRCFWDFCIALFGGGN